MNTYERRVTCFACLPTGQRCMREGQACRTSAVCTFEHAANLLRVLHGQCSMRADKSVSACTRASESLANVPSLKQPGRFESLGSSDHHCLVDLRHHRRGDGGRRETEMFQMSKGI
jgi:hypothetical protein